MVLAKLACSDAARQSAVGGETSSRSGQVSGGACRTSGSGDRCAQSHSLEMLGHDAVMAGWEALHQALDVMGIQSVEVCRSGFQDMGSHNHDGVPMSAGVRKNDS